MGPMTTPSPSDTDTIILTVTADGFPDPSDLAGQTVARFIGSDPETGENIIFAVDHRFVDLIVQAVLVEGEIDVAIEPWQILGKGAF